jgi:hypothetical protein
MAASDTFAARFARFDFRPYDSSEPRGNEREQRGGRLGLAGKWRAE